MGNTQRFLPVLLSSALCFFFVACGGGSDGTDAMPITPNAGGNELERIAAEMNQGLNQYLGTHVDNLISGAQSGTFDLSLVTSLLGGAQNLNSSWLPQRYNQWTLACNNPQILPTIGLSQAGCINSFWHTLGASGVQNVINPIISGTSPNHQFLALTQVLSQANTGGIQIPQWWLNAGQNALLGLGASLGL